MTASEPLTTADLPPFSGDTPRCTKCGYDQGADTEYVSGRGGGWVDYNPPYGPQASTEHLRRHCGRCGYTWPEATVPETGLKREHQ